MILEGYFFHVTTRQYAFRYFCQMKKTTVKDEVYYLCRALQEIRKCQSRLFIELGVLSAQGTVRLSSFISELYNSFRYIGVDYNSLKDVSHRWIRKTKNLFTTGRVMFIHGKSDFVGNNLDASIAFIFIDACHCYECVKKDIAAWRDKIELGGYMTFHDTGAKVQGRPVQDSHDGSVQEIQVVKAIEDSKLTEQFELKFEFPRRYGCRCYQRIK